MDAITFDDLEQLDSSKPRKPFFAIDINSDKEVHQWLKDELSFLQKENSARLEKIKNNYLRYKGIQYINQVYQPRDIEGVKKKYTPQMVLPFIADSVDEKTARMLEIKPSVAVIPVHDESKDKVDAKIAKRFLGHIDYVQNTDKKFQKLLKNSKLAGESYLWLRWNPDLGEMVGPGVYQGDVEIKNMTPHWVFYENAVRYEDVNYVFLIELEYNEALKKEYPDKADSIKEHGEAKVIDFSSMEEKKIAGMSKKIHFYHKANKYLPQGYECCFTQDVIFKRGPLSYKHGKLPIIRLPDIENDEELHAEPHIEKVRGIASQINNMLNSAVKMTMLAGWAKWFVEAGSVDEQQLNNDVSIVKVKAGAGKPVLAQANPVGAGHFNFMDMLKNMYYDFSKSNSVVRGEPPKGVTAFVALQYVSESESRRMNTDVANFNMAVRDTYDMILNIAGQFYQPNDERTMFILGKDGKWDKFPLDNSTLTKPYSVMIQNASGLSDSKAIRTQQIIDLNQQFPNMFTKEQVSEMLDLGQGDKFLDVAGSAARAAEQENEEIQDGKGQIDPAEYEDHITHWKVHVASMQSLGFKQKAGPEIIAQMEDHIRAHEMIMMEQAMKNPMYMQLLGLQVQQFPIFMTPPPGLLMMVGAGNAPAPMLPPENQGVGENAPMIPQEQGIAQTVV